MDRKADLFGGSQSPAGRSHHRRIVHRRNVDGDVVGAFLIGNAARHTRVRAGVARIVYGRGERGAGTGGIRAVQIRDRAGAARCQQVVYLSDGAAERHGSCAVAARDGHTRVPFGHGDGPFGDV